MIIDNFGILTLALSIFSILLSMTSVWAIIRYYIDREKSALKISIDRVSEGIFKDDDISGLVSQNVSRKILKKILYERIALRKAVRDLPWVINYNGRIFTAPAENLKDSDFFRKYVTFSYDGKQPTLFIQRKYFAYCASDDEDFIDPSKTMWVETIDVLWNPINNEIKINGVSSTNLIFKDKIKLYGVFGIEKNDNVMSKIIKPELINFKLPLPKKVIHSLKKELINHSFSRVDRLDLGRSFININPYIFKRKQGYLNLRLNISEAYYFSEVELKGRWRIDRPTWKHPIKSLQIFAILKSAKKINWEIMVKEKKK